MTHSTQSFTVNGRTYTPPPRPVVAVCLDGCADDYLDAAQARGRLPNIQRFGELGWRGLARAAMPTFTNVNNAGIVTGVPPRIHGMAGNYFWDAANAREVMMNSASFLRAETIFPAAQRAGRRVAVVTAKEKLRDIFASGLVSEGGIAFSSERASSAGKAVHGIEGVESLVGPTPEIYSGEASLYVLRAGVTLLERGQADWLYLSTSDFIQHKHDPDSPAAVDFLSAIDALIGRLHRLGAVIGVTADHGMNAKQGRDGSPNVIFLESELDATFGCGCRVILPITDPYVVHHGALGSFAVIHLAPQLDVDAVMRWLRQRAGLTEVLDRGTASRLLELPPDRIGDIVVSSARNVVIGRTPEWHDLGSVAEGLRSHGGRYEEMVPILLSEPPGPVTRRELLGDVRNFDLFHLICHGAR